MGDFLLNIYVEYLSKIFYSVVKTPMKKVNICTVFSILQFANVKENKLNTQCLRYKELKHQYLCSFSDDAGLMREHRETKCPTQLALRHPR